MPSPTVPNIRPNIAGRIPAISSVATALLALTDEETHANSTIRSTVAITTLFTIDINVVDVDVDVVVPVFIFIFPS